MDKRFYQIIISLLLCLILSGCGNLSGASSNTSNLGGESYTIQQQTGTEDNIDDLEWDETGLIKRDDAAEKEDSNHDGDTLEVHYIDIGQGDCVLIKQGKNAMLIDAGNNSKGTAVWSYLLSQDVGALDYAVGTHPDADHIGGLDVVLYKLDCDTVFMPSIEKDTKTYQELIDVIEERNQKYVVPKRGDIYTLGKARFEILTDTDKDYGENTNDYSIALRVVFGDTSFLFTGDAEEEAEKDMLASGLTLSSDVYKAAHHGADTANTEKFLTMVNPEYCVISCGQDNTYGHPRAGFLNHLRAMGIKVYRTDEQGTIVAVSDGTAITFNTGPSETWKAGEPVGGGEQPDKENEDNNLSTGNDGALGNYNADTSHYVLNTDTKKFHRADCSSVSKMAEKNKKESNKTREELMADGYEPCKNCKP